MGLFERKRFVWNEPWFFQQRIRTTKGWVIFALLLVAIAAAIGATLYFTAGRAGRMGLFEIVGLSLGVAAAAWWVLDGTETRRQAVLFGESLVVGGDMGKYSRPTEYKLAKIASAAIVHPEESKWPATALFFLYEGQEQGIGIESKVSLPKLAQTLHDAGVPTRLDGWHPNQQREFDKAFSWQAGPTQAVEKATLETLPPGSPGLVSAGAILLAIVRQCWALALWLVILAAAVYYGWRNWNDLELVQAVLMIGIPIGTLWLATEFTERFASAATSQGLVRSGKQQIRQRSGLAVDPDGELIPVEILEREQFARSIQKIHETGFLQADNRGRRLLFEGQKERWSIPAASIRSLAIEEVQVGTPGQSAMGALHYFVVIRFAGDTERELGIRYSEREYGKFDDVKRAEGAIRVFEAVESILPAA